MNFLRNLPIRRKLTLVILLICGSVLVLASVALFFFQSITTNEQMIREISELGRTIAHSCTAAAAFNDHEAAEQVLSGLEGRPDIEGACLVLANGQHVVAVDRDGDHDEAVEKTLLEDHRPLGTDLLFASPVMLDEKRLGTLYLRADFRPAQNQLRNLYLKTLAGVLGVSLLLALVLASRLQRLITDPILDLASIVDRVAKKADYSLQATKAGNDEIGELTDAFNDMLDQIRSRDDALQAARDGFEKRVEDRTRELATSVSVLNATLDSTADGILAVHLSGKVVSYNSQFALMWGIPPDVLERGDAAEMMGLATSQVKDSERFTAAINALYATSGVEAFEVIELEDGRVFERHVKPQWVDGESVGMVLNFRDITKRRFAEGELEKVHQQLLETSRKAGMAEVATSVLHNVGNVLNSVNVSCSVISDKVRQSRISSVTKTAELFREHEGDLAEFLTIDPTGQKLPDFLGKLAGRLSEEQTTILSELKSLSQNIEHIKDIVAVQQSHAKNVGGVRETLSLEGLVEDALRMNAGALIRHRVEVIREYSDTPPVALEKSKVLQILMNLVRNAKHALNDRGGEDKRLVVRIAHTNDHVAVSVRDNGTGIAPENLTRIFAHGFTTKKDGHGFGLHSGVLAAREMGGRLSVQSDGLGAGATFTLSLPLSGNS